MQVADSGATALAMLDHAQRIDRPFSVLVAEGKMAEMDGLTLAAHVLASHGATRAPSLVLLTGTSDHKVVDQAETLGIHCLTGTPMVLSHLHQIVQTALAHRATQRRRAVAEAWDVDATLRGLTPRCDIGTNSATHFDARSDLPLRT